MKSGIVEWYDPNNEHGFIFSHEGDSIFVHYSGLIDKGTRNLPHAGDSVSYETAASRQGPKAVNVRIVSRPSSDTPADPQSAG